MILQDHQAQGYPLSAQVLESLRSLLNPLLEVLVPPRVLPSGRAARATSEVCRVRHSPQRHPALVSELQHLVNLQRHSELHQLHSALRRVQDLERLARLNQQRVSAPTLASEPRAAPSDNRPHLTLSGNRPPPASGKVQHLASPRGHRLSGQI